MEELTNFLDNFKDDSCNTCIDKDFNPLQCLIPTVYCGNKDIPPKYKTGDKNIFKRKGTSRECFTKGFGAGMYSNKLKNTPGGSLKTIPYIGERYESNFKEYTPRINNTDDLMKFCKTKTIDHIYKMLRKVLLKKNNIVDEKAYNSVLMYLYDSGIKKLPVCVKLY